MFDSHTTTIYAYHTSFSLEKSTSVLPVFFWHTGILKLHEILKPIKYFKFFYFVKQFFQSLATVKSVKNVASKNCQDCNKTVIIDWNKKLNQPIRLLQTEKRERTANIHIDFRNSSYCPSDDDTGKRDLLLTIKDQINDNTTSIEFDNTTSFARHIFDLSVNCPSNCRMPFCTDSCHKCLP